MPTKNWTPFASACALALSGCASVSSVKCPPPPTLPPLPAALTVRREPDLLTDVALGIAADGDAAVRERNLAIDIAEQYRQACAAGTDAAR